MTDERAKRVLGALVVKLVVSQIVRLLLLIPRMSRQEVRDRLGPGVAGSEVERHPGAEERAEGFEKGAPCVAVAHQRRN